MSLTRACDYKFREKAMHSGLSLKIVFTMGNAFAMETTPVPA